MQKDLGGEIHILGVNAAGHESGNAGICQGRTLPWLQDTDDQDVWQSWNVTWRDVIVLDEESRLVVVYNLTEHDLGETANHDSLMALLRRAAGTTQGN